MARKAFEDMSRDEISDYLQRSDAAPQRVNGQTHTDRGDYRLSQYQRKRINDAIIKDHRFRLTAATDTLPWSGKIKAWGTYLLTSGRAEYPRMSMIVDTLVRQMMEKADRLESVVNDMVRDGERLHSYVISLAERSIESARIVQESAERRLEYKEIMETLEERMGRENDRTAKLECLKNRYIAKDQYMRHSSLCIQHTVLGNLDEQRFHRMEGMRGFVLAVQHSSELMLKVSKAMNEEIDHVKFVYDIVPDVLQHKLDLDYFQKKGTKLGESYRPIHDGLLEVMDTIYKGMDYRKSLGR
jgi:hypothetical protein